MKIYPLSNESAAYTVEKHLIDEHNILKTVPVTELLGKPGGWCRIETCECDVTLLICSICRLVLLKSDPSCNCE